MREFKPSLPFNVESQLLIPTSTYIKGTLKKVYPASGESVFISFKTFGGTETNSNGSVVIENTGVVQTWYRPDISADCRLVIGGLPYEVISPPENINMANQYLQFKVRAVKGGA